MKTWITQIWMVCHLLPFAKEGQYMGAGCTFFRTKIYFLIFFLHHINAQTLRSFIQIACIGITLHYFASFGWLIKKNLKPSCLTCIWSDGWPTTKNAKIMKVTCSLSIYLIDECIYCRIRGYNTAIPALYRVLF